MAPLSNAERQKLYRQRLQQRASLDSLGEQARRAVDRAVEALWSHFNRETPGGGRWGDVSDYETVTEWRSALAADPQGLIDYCRSVTADDGALDTELASMRAVVEAHDAITLAAERPTKRKR